MVLGKHLLSKQTNAPLFLVFPSFPGAGHEQSQKELNHPGESHGRGTGQPSAVIRLPGWGCITQLHGPSARIPEAGVFARNPSELTFANVRGLMIFYNWDTLGLRMDSGSPRKSPVQVNLRSVAPPALSMSRLPQHGPPTFPFTPAREVETSGGGNHHCGAYNSISSFHSRIV